MTSRAVPREPEVAAGPEATGAAGELGATGTPGGADAAERRTTSGRAGRRLASWLKEIVIIVVSALVLSMLIKTFLVQSFYIPSESMQDTLEVGDRVLVSKLAPGPFDLHRGDVVVFRDPGGWLSPSEASQRTGLQRTLADALTFVGLMPQDSGEHLIKRVIGLPSDTVACCDEQGRVSVNGVSLDEPYLADGVRPSELEFSVVVPEGRLWVMGDNRPNSRDSRYKQGDPGGGTIPLANVVGTAFVTLWPIDRWSVLRNPGATFAEVP